MKSGTSQTSPLVYARVAGTLFLLSFLAGGLGEFYIPSQLIVSADAAATAKNILTSNLLFRIGFATYLIEAMCDVALTGILYILLRPVHKNLALIAVFFRLTSTILFGMAEFFYFAALPILGGADYLKTFSSDQLHTLALLSLKLSAYGGEIFMAFYGIASILLGFLIFQSGYLPKWLGVLLALGGIGFVFKNFALVLAPELASSLLLLPMIIAGLSLKRSVMWVKDAQKEKLSSLCNNRINGLEESL